MRIAIQRVVVASFCAAALAAVGCADGSVSPVSPSPAVSSVVATPSGTGASPGSASSPRSGALHVSKACPPETYAGRAGDFCTLTSSNLSAIEVGSKVTYAQAADFATLMLDSDVVLDVPGPGNNKAFGHCHLNLATGRGLCTFSGGTGKFTFFNASVDVTPPTDGVNWHWDGTYTFSPRD